MIVEAPTLSLPDRVDAHLLCPDVLVFKRVISWGQQLIRLAEQTGNFCQSTQITPGGKASYTNEFRTSSGLCISHKVPRWGSNFLPYEVGLANAFHSCVRYYKSYNKHLNVTDDTGYEMLRYQPGQEFGEHVDAITGREEGFRQLSALVYLNDDYRGGELIFPRHSVSIKPEEGDIVMFPSNFVYPHLSSPILKGTKYSVVTWFVSYPNKEAS